MADVRPINFTATASESDLNSDNFLWLDTPQKAKKLPGDAIAPKSVLDNVVQSFAPEFDPDVQCVAGRLYVYKGSLLRCKTTYTGPFDETKFFSDSGINGVGFATYAISEATNDLNDCFENVVYVCTDNGIGSSVLHKPDESNYFILYTIPTKVNAKLQYYVGMDDRSIIYMRSFWGQAGWSDWLKISDTDESALHNIGPLSATTVSTAPYNDLNTFPINEVAIAIASYSAVAHKPTDESFNVFTFGGTNGGKCQIVSTITKKMFMRSCWGGTWSEWVEIGDKKDETFIDVLNQFDNIVCVGDSLTWSQVYTSATSSRQAKKTYPAVLGEITHATAEALAYPGDKTTDAWNRWKNTFESKTNALAIIFLGTNGGFTDTLSTDCPVGVDYTQWADTNTGCYGKIISKLQELGYKIILIQPFAVGQTSDLTITKKVVTDAGTRFGCAVVQSFRTTEDKYHYYPDGSGKNTLHYNDFGYSWFAYTLCEKVNNLDNDNMKLIIPS